MTTEDNDGREALENPPMKPKRDTRFKPGQSGNPLGRRAKIPRAEVPSQLGRDLRAVGRVTTMVKTSAGEKGMSLTEALMYRLWMDAINGKVTAQRMVIALLKEAYQDVAKNIKAVEMFDEVAVIYPDSGSKSKMTRQWVKSIQKKTSEW